MAVSYLKPIMMISLILLGMFIFIKKTSKRKFDLEIDEHELLNHVQLPTGYGLTKAHALHFQEVFLDILLNKHNRFEGHAENVQLLNYILRNDVKWRVTETAIFKMFDVTGSDYISKQEFESFTNLFPRISDKRLIENFWSVVDRNIDTKIIKIEWFNFCNKNMRPKLIQDLQEWEQEHKLQLPNHKNITAQYTTTNWKERSNRDLIHGQIDRATDMMSEDFMVFVDHWENGTPHTIDDPDMFVRRLGYWIVNNFERWDSVYMWIYQILDDNGDGQLTPQEMAQQFKIFEVSTVHVKEIFNYLDEDGDGIIDRDEWADFSQTIRKLLRQHYKEIEPNMQNYS